MKVIPRTISICSLLLLSTLAVSADIRSGLVSYYSFEGSVQDSFSTNHFVGMPLATPPALTATNSAPRTNAVQMNGTSQYLMMEHAVADPTASGMPIFRTGAYSIAFWVKGPPQTARYIFTSAHTNNTGTNFTVALFILQTGNAALSNGKLDALIRTDGNGTLINHAVSSSTVFDNTWHHVAWVDDRGTVKLYIDGQLDANTALFNYNRGGNFTFNRSALGALVRGSAAGFFNGSFDDVSVWERTLSQAEVQEIMANGISTTSVPPLLPIITAQPKSVTKYYLDNVTFSVTAAASRPDNALSYQWYKNNELIPDATTQTYRAFALTPANSGEVYKVSVSNNVGVVTSSDATLTVLPDGPADVRNLLVSHWPMDSITNNGGLYSSVDVYSRNDLFLTNMNENNLKAGQFGNSLLFDSLSTNYAVRVGGIPAYNTNGYSVSLWVNGDQFQPADTRVYSESSTNTSALFTIGSVGAGSTSAQIYVRNDNSIELVKRSSTRPVFDGAWHHLVWTDTNGAGRLYVDGVLDETDFGYNPSTLTLNVSSVGAVVRANISNLMFGYVDELATWKRPLSYTEIQEIKLSNIPAPLGATPPSFLTQPVGTNVMTRTDIALSVSVEGTAPFSYQWFKGVNPVSGATNPVLSITNIQLSDAGTYKVTVANSAGSTNSANAVVNVTARPLPPVALAIDFNERADSTNTADGFQSFMLGGIGASAATHYNIFGGVEVTVDGTGNTTIDSRRRSTPTNSGEFTEERLLQDFIYSTPTTGSNGLDVTVKYLKPNQPYTITIWSYDTQNPANRVSDWFVNGVLLKDDYTFDGAVLPTNNLHYQFTMNSVSDGTGTLLLQGRRADLTVTNVSVFLNAIRIEEPITKIGAVELVGGNLRLTIQTPDSSKAHTVEETASLTGSVSWTSVGGATTTVTTPNSLQIEFAQPVGPTRFYRINRAE